jgi:hypothetical protein
MGTKSSSQASLHLPCCSADKQWFHQRYTEQCNQSFRLIVRLFSSPKCTHQLWCPPSPVHLLAFMSGGGGRQPFFTHHTVKKVGSFEWHIDSSTLSLLAVAVTTRMTNLKPTQWVHSLISMQSQSTLYNHQSTQLPLSVLFLPVTGWLMAVLVL